MYAHMCTETFCFLSCRSRGKLLGVLSRELYYLVVGIATLSLVEVGLLWQLARLFVRDHLYSVIHGTFREYVAHV